MNEFNHNLFLWINAPEAPNVIILGIAIFFAKYAIWMVPTLIGIAWLRCGEHTRKVLLEATASGMAGLLINQLIGFVWEQPRPFMINLGNTFIDHAPDSSFPSDHLTLLWAIAFSFLIQRHPKAAGVTLTLLGLPVAWARIYVGVHFPLDIAGAFLVATLSAWLAMRESKWYLQPLFSHVNRVNHFIFDRLIKKGWVHE